MCVVVAGSTGGLQDDDGAEVELRAGRDAEDVPHAGIARPHERAQERRISIEPRVQVIRHGQDHVAVGDAGQESSSDKLGPAVGVDLGAGQAEAGLAGEGDSTSFSAGQATVLHKAHLLRIAAVQHLLDGCVAGWDIEARIDDLEVIPVIPEDLLERGLVDAFHGRAVLAG